MKFYIPSRFGSSCRRVELMFGRCCVDVSRSLGVNYWKLDFYLRAKLECRVFGALRPLIWWSWGGFSPDLKPRAINGYKSVQSRLNSNLSETNQAYIHIYIYIYIYYIYSALRTRVN